MPANYPWYDPNNWINKIRQGAGRAVGNLGANWRLPEMGISERIAGLQTPKARAASKAAFGAPQYGPFQSELTGQVAGTQTAQAPAPLDSGTGGGGGGTEEPPFEAWFEGTKYTDPSAYQEAVSGRIREEYKRSRAGLDDDYNTGLITFEDRERELKNLRDKTLQSQQGYFSAISPQAIQSQQGTYAGEVREEYGRGEEQRVREKSSFTADVLDAQSGLESNYLNQLDLLQNNLTDYISQGRGDNVLDAYNAPGVGDTPQQTLDSFQRQNLTNKFYGRAVPSRAKGTVSKKKVPVAPEDFIYG